MDGNFPDESGNDVGRDKHFYSEASVVFSLTRVLDDVIQ